MDDFIKNQGLPFMAHLLRRLADDFIRNIASWYEESGVKAPPRTHSTMLALRRHGPMSVTEVASLLRQSHPLVITWVRQLKALGFIATNLDPADGRRTVLSLTSAGTAEVQKHEEADRVVGRAFEHLMKEVDADVFDGLWRIEEACRQVSFHDRLIREMTRLSSADQA